MNRRCRTKGGGAIGRKVPLFLICGLILLTGLLPGFLAPHLATAAGSVAMTGTWANQVLQIPQGSYVTSQSAYVTVFNPDGDLPITVNMNTIAPTGVTVTLSTSEFVVQPASQRQVSVQQVSVSPDTVPGDYQIEIVANAFYEDTGGVQILPAVGQTANLAVTGESALVVVDMVSPSGQPIWAVIRLFKVINGSQHEFAYSTTGHLEATVSPGHYRVEAYSSSGEQLAEPQEFDIADGEEQRLTLTANMIYFESFAINPAYNTESGELGYVQIVYTANNVYQPVPNAEVRLTVTLDGSPLEEVSIFTLNPFNVGRIGVPYNYSPANGWHGGTYGFSLQLYVDGELYASTQPQTLQVGSSSALPWWIFIIAALGGGLLIGGIIMFFKRRKKQDKPEKARKSQKHERKEGAAEGETAGGMALGFKRLLKRGDKTARKPVVPATGAAATRAAAVARKDAAATAETQQPHKATPPVDTAKPAGLKPVAAQATPAVKPAVEPKPGIAAPPPIARPAAPPAQAGAPIKPPAAQPATPQAPRAAPAAAHIKSAADLKKVITSRQADGVTPPPAATPATPARQATPASTTAPPAVATARKEPLTVPSPFAAPRQGPPTKKAHKKGAAQGPAPVSTSPASSPAAPVPPQPLHETAAARASAATVTPESIEPLPVPSPFLTPKELRAAEEAMAARNAQVEAAPAPGSSVEEPAPVPPAVTHEKAEISGELPAEAAVTPPRASQDAAPVPEPASEPAAARTEDVEATAATMADAAVIAPAAPPVTNEEVGAGPAADKVDTAVEESQAEGKSEDQPPQAPEEEGDDEAAKKFVSPIRFLNR